MSPIELCERGFVPDVIARAGMRRLIARRLKDESGRTSAERAAWLGALRHGPIAIDTQAANEQHYEVPAAFFQAHLGPRLKYSCCLYPTGRESLAEAEERMLERCAERAGVQDGHRILDLGCGWGSLSLWLAQRYPRSHIVGLSNSTGQRQFILQRAGQLGLANLSILTGNVAEFDFSAGDLAGGFDRVMSVEMFEHMRNYEALLAKVARWLRPGGQLFVHIFAHKTLCYPFEERDQTDWMTRYFFRGGLMPSQRLLGGFQDQLRLDRQWWLPGTHYARTANHWLEGMDADRRAIAKIFRSAYGAKSGDRWVQRWRMFYMAVAELFAFDDGREWGVGHYLLAPPGAAAPR